MNHYINEVLEAHVAIENWLGKGEGDVQTLLDRFSQDYSMITITGTMLDHESLGRFFVAKRASRPGLHIVVDSLCVLEEWKSGRVGL
ncbi:cytoplasmic protein [Xenorhabdus miraniensis]|uniref:Cytoplasmic protein n=1 Tax=Xenorhabdus miraniensis TaxID=351674 RepID=A0A2D0JT61_9GAMM|nr:cytoplasmic protein [Xenorhabdus miraniensis]